MTLQEARAIVALKDTSTADKRTEFLIALKIVSGNAFVRQN